MSTPAPNSTSADASAGAARVPQPLAVQSGSLTAISPRRPGRLALTGLAWLYMFLAIPVVGLFALELAFIPATVLTLGIFALVAIVPAVGGVALAHRRLAEFVLGEPVPSPYRKVDGPLWRRPLSWARDPARWRDLAWLAVASTLGWVMAILAVTWFLSIFWFLVFPLLWAVTPPDVFSTQLGFITIDSQAQSFVMWAFAAVSFVIWWFVTPALVRAHAWIDREMLSRRSERLAERVRVLAETRAQSLDMSAAELRRIERDLHDGAQARLVSLGMSLGMADELIGTDPAAARRLIAEARQSTSAALGDLRSVVRGMHPPVLADRGLVGAVQALALDMAIPVTVVSSLVGRPPLPVESAAYFAVAESLANTAKHSGATHAWVEIGWAPARPGQVEREGDGGAVAGAPGLLRVDIGDDGCGGARLVSSSGRGSSAVAGPAPGGSGLRGIARRLAAFDGTLALSSPDGGPTIVRLEVPCALSSPRTTSFFETD